jgi:hypothetical protein
MSGSGEVIFHEFTNETHFKLTKEIEKLCKMLEQQRRKLSSASSRCSWDGLGMYMSDNYFYASSRCAETMNWLNGLSLVLKCISTTNSGLEVKEYTGNTRSGRVLEDLGIYDEFYNFSKVERYHRQEEFAEVLRLIGLLLNELENNSSIKDKLKAREDAKLEAERREKERIKKEEDEARRKWESSLQYKFGRRLGCY